jgi:RimJ/RimL family protein N-acetyltransferase
MSTITVDRVDHTDRDQVRALAGSIAALVAAINAEPQYRERGIGTALPPAMTADEVAALIERLGDRGGVFYCRDGPEVVGFATVQPDREEPQTAIMGVWVRASHRRRGLGTELARLGTEFVREQGYTKLRGTIPAGNEPALSFFSAIGPIVQLEGGGMGYELPVT